MNQKYVPILKWKQGEQKALEDVPTSIKRGMIPLLEIPPIDWDFKNKKPKKTIDKHLNNVINTIKKSWGIESPVFLDLIWINTEERMISGKHPLEEILQNSRSQNVNIIPVTSPNRDVVYQNEVKSAHKQDQLGICFRLKENDFGDLQNNINNLLKTLNVTPEEVDLLIDYDYTDPANKTRTIIFLNNLLNSIPYIHQWRNLILSGTSFPKDIAQVKSNSIGIIERSEWLIWKNLINSKKLIRNPEFSDYAVANPEPFEGDPRVIKMSANIRYTNKDKFLIFKGLQVRKHGSNQYHALALQAVTHPEYYGSLYSAGDKFIYDVSKRSTNPGNATSWRQVGTNHHLTVVVSELSTFPLI